MVRSVPELPIREEGTKMSFRKHFGLFLLIFSLCLIAVCSLPVSAQSPTGGSDADLKYQKLMVPMRDGVKLETVVLRPVNEQGALPIMLTRTPYGVPKEGEYRPDPNNVVTDPYIVVIQNVRGRFGSEGEFEMFRPPRSLRDPKAVDEVTDSWDSVDWLVRNIPDSNGRVGMTGSSYDGWLVMQASLKPHPALKAAI